MSVPPTARVTFVLPDSVDALLSKGNKAKLAEATGLRSLFGMRTRPTWMDAFAPMSPLLNVLSFVGVDCHEDLVCVSVQAAVDALASFDTCMESLKHMAAANTTAQLTRAAESFAYLAASTSTAGYLHTSSLMMYVSTVLKAAAELSYDGILFSKMHCVVVHTFAERVLNPLFPIVGLPFPVYEAPGDGETSYVTDTTWTL